MGEPDQFDAGPNLPVFEFGSAAFEKFQNQAPPATLYHYTDQAGLRGIITSGELWATKVQYMNDASEFKIAPGLVKKLIEERTSDIDDYELQLFDTIIEHISHMAYINICSVSFCTDPDLLSQWRGYSGSGVGYAIGFCSTTLSEVAGNDGCRLGRCIYDQDVQIAIVRELMDQLVHQAARYISSDAYVVNLLLASAFENALIKFGAFFKDAAFIEEDEWRLITEVKFYNEDTFQFRVGKSMLIPYYCLDIRGKSWNNKIADLTIGPCPHPELSKHAVNGLLVNQFVSIDGRTLPQVRISKVPYRIW